MSQCAPLRHEIRSGRVGAVCSDDGVALRDITLDGIIVLRAIAFIIRDADWGTYSLAGDMTISDQGDSVILSTSGILGTGSSRLSWSVAFELHEAGIKASCKASCQASGSADVAEFATNRTGLVVLHALHASRGADAAIIHASGGRSRDGFPAIVSPRQIFRDVRNLSYRTVSGIAVDIAFEGEVFETEDQRNWTDAPFKTYGRPLDLPFPYSITADAPVDQRIAVTLSRPAPPALAGNRSAEKPSEAVLADPVPLPPFGTAITLGRAPLLPAMLTRLADLHLSFVLIEIDPSLPDYQARLRDHLLAIDGDVQLAVRLHGRDDAPAVLKTIEGCLVGRVAGQRLLRLSLWDCDEVGMRHARLLFPDIPIGAGTAAFFAEFNRAPAQSAIDHTGWSANPTVHGCDDDTLGESVEALPDLIATAKTKQPGTPLAIGPLTLGGRFNPNATSNEMRRKEAEPDVRQAKPIAAAWLLAMLAGYLDQAVCCFSLFEPCGPKGLLGSSGAFTPAAHLLARLGRYRSAPVRTIAWESEPRARGLLFETPGERVLVLAVMREHGARLTLPDGGWSNAQALTESGFEAVLLPGPVIAAPGFVVLWFEGEANR